LSKYEEVYGVCQSIIDRAYDTKQEAEFGRNQQEQPACEYPWGCSENQCTSYYSWGSTHPELDDHVCDKNWTD
jgi:hypothetical protein